MGNSIKRQRTDNYDSIYDDYFSEEDIPDLELDELLNGNQRTKKSRKKKGGNVLNNKRNNRTSSMKLPHGWEDFDYGHAEDYRYDD